MLKLPAFFRRTSRRTSTRPVDDSLEAFGSERSSGQIPSSPNPVESVGRRTVAAGLLAFGVLPALVIGGYALDGVRRPSPPLTMSASLTIESDPAGAEVHIDGTRKGTTPLTLRVAPGPQTVEVVLGEHRQTWHANAAEGANVVHRVAFVPAADPPAVPVKTSGSAPSRRTTRAGRPAGPVAGWLSVRSPVRLQIMQGSQVIGTTDSPRIMVPAGRHQLKFANPELGFSHQRVVNVQPGRNASVQIEVPSAPLNLNAIPWADAWVDGAHVGTTPIGNYRVPIGTHEVLFRHPQLGERRETVVVSLSKPARVSVDMREPRP